MVYMTDGGVTAKSTCLPHTPRQGGAVLSDISVLLFGDAGCLYLCMFGYLKTQLCDLLKISFSFTPIHGIIYIVFFK